MTLSCTLCVCLCVRIIHWHSRAHGCGAASLGAGETAGRRPAADAELQAETEASLVSPSPCTSGKGSQKSSAQEEGTTPRTFI